MTASSAPKRLGVMDILKDDKSVTHGVDEASRHHDVCAILLRQTDCVNCFGSTGHGSTLRPLHASVRLHPSCNPGTTALTLLVSSRQTRLTSAASDVGRHIPDEVHLDSGQ